jgi:hypothetical protein
MGNTWITDLRHFLGDDGDVAAFAGRRLALHLCQIVAAVTEKPAHSPRDTSLACRRRPGHQPCPGRIQAGFDGSTNRIRWLCPSCGDNGWISGWQATRWDHGQRPPRPTIRGITYRRGMIRTFRERAALPVALFQGASIPPQILDAIHDNDLFGVAGEFGDPDVGEPMQYDELTIDRAGGTDTIMVFNRAIMLFKTNDDFFVRFHRVACLIDDLRRPNNRLHPAAGAVRSKK